MERGVGLQTLQSGAVRHQCGQSLLTYGYRGGRSMNGKMCLTVKEFERPLNKVLDSMIQKKTERRKV